MAQQPRYNSTIAPSQSTGEVLDERSAGLAAANASAKQSLANNVTALGNQAVNTVGTVGGIFERLNDLNNRSTMLSRANQLKAETNGVIENLKQNTQLLSDWAVDSGGGPSDYMRQWQEARRETLSEGLSNRYRKEFELILEDNAITMNKTIGDMALNHAHSVIKAEDIKAGTDFVENVDPENIQGSTEVAVMAMMDTLEEGERQGIYTPVEVAQGIAIFEDQMIIAGHTKAVSQIQFGEGLPGTDYPKSYGGAMDYIEDMVEAGQLNQDQADSLMAQMATRDSQRWSQGSKQQQAMSNETFMEFLNRIDAAKRGEGEWPTNDEILAHEAWRPDTTHKNWSRPGDTQSPRTLISYLEDAQKPASGAAWDKWDEFKNDDMKNLYWDRFTDNERWSQAVRDNQERWGLSDRGAVEWAKSSRSNVFLDAAEEISEHVDARFNAQIAALNRDGKFDEANALYAQAEEEKVILNQQIQEGTYSRDNGEEVIGRMISNYYNNKISGEIFRDWEDPDRKLNYAEELNLMALEGNLMGQSLIPRVNEDLRQMAKLHQHILEKEGYSIVQNNGNQFVGDGVWGQRGTMHEGRVSFLVKDPYNDRNKWVTMTADESGEEVINERGYDWQGNEIWQQANAVILNRIAADRVFEEEGVEADTRVGIADLVNSGATPEALAAEGYTPTEIEEVLPGYGDRQGTKPLELTMKWYNTAVAKEGAQIDYDSIVYQAQAKGANIDEVIEEVYMAQRPTITHILRDMFDDDDRALWRTKINGEVIGRRSAGVSAGQVVMRYGLPPQYGEKMLAELYDWSR